MSAKNAPQERARRYRERAAKLIQMSQDAATLELRATCLSLASSWQELALAAERSVNMNLHEQV